MYSQNENIVNFYVDANQNKYNIYKKDKNRDYSVAEATILSCIDAVVRHSEYATEISNWDVNIVIKMILLNSLDGKMDSLSNKHKYDSLLNDFHKSESGEALLAGASLLKIKDNIRDSNETIDSFLNNYSKLQTVIRQGHIYWGAKGDRLESVLEHIYGCMILALGIECEYGYCINFNKIFMMLLLHETEEIKIGDITEWDGINQEEKINLGKKAVNEVLEKLNEKQYYIKLLDEFNSHCSLESEYAHLCDKLEYDMQVKMYQLLGRYDFDHIPSNVVTNSSSVQSIINNGANSVFDVHYEYDKNRYSKIPCLRAILELTKKM